jgi:hypothetical protein
MSHVAELEKNIAAAQKELTAVDAELRAHHDYISAAVSSGQPSGDIDRLQLDRDATSRKRERVLLQLDALQSRMPDTLRRDARDSVGPMKNEITTRVKRLATVYEKVAETWQAFTAALEACATVQRECADIADERSALLTLCVTHDIEPPELPPLPTFFCEDVRATNPIRNVSPLMDVHVPRFRACAAWTPTVSKAAQQQREVAEAEAARRQAQAWLTGDPRTRIPANELPATVVNQFSKEEWGRYFYVVPTGSH